MEPFSHNNTMDDMNNDTTPEATEMPMGDDAVETPEAAPEETGAGAA